MRAAPPLGHEVRCGLASGCQRWGPTQHIPSIVFWCWVVVAMEQRGEQRVALLNVWKATLT